MADKTATQDTEPTFLVDAAEAISRLGHAMVDVARQQDLLRQTLERTRETVTALDARVQLLTKLGDHHQAVLERAGLAKPRPKGSADVN